MSLPNSHALALIEKTRARLRGGATDAAIPGHPASLPVTVLSPYRINPLGAHVDHQGGNVLAQTIDQYTILSFLPTNQPTININCLQPTWPITQAQFSIGQQDSETNWVRYAQAAVAALNTQHPLSYGIDAVIGGTLVGAGLSSSASVVLAYLTALAHANTIGLMETDLVELSRQVENDFMGLNNGIQDQMSIVYGNASALAHLDVRSGKSTAVPTPQNDSVAWVILYSGYSRELITSGFNTRVAECKQAAAALQEGANILGDVTTANRSSDNLQTIDPVLAKRAKHFFSETARVSEAAQLWQRGEWKAFGKLMNESCHSSINYYESGSAALIDAHDIAKHTDGVIGSRFGGGGYGGCLMMLCEKSKTAEIRQSVLTAYLERYPDRVELAQCFDTQAVNGLGIYDAA